MYLIVGLGNPGTEYEKTFHNMGYLAVADAANLLRAKFKKKECESMVAEAYVNGEKVILARPLTFMNNSGRAVKQLMAKYKIEKHELLVIYDDYDLPKGVGIRDSEVNIPIINYVLASVRQEDYELFASALERAAKAAVMFASGHPIEAVMNEYNGK